MGVTVEEMMAKELLELRKVIINKMNKKLNCFFYTIKHKNKLGNLKELISISNYQTALQPQTNFEK